MPFKRNRPKPLFVKAGELALATPQVVVHRVTRIALAGACPSPRDRKEFQRMTTEKIAAASESWNAMAIEATRANVSLSASWFRMVWCPWLGGTRPFPSHLHKAAVRVLDKGIGPVHRRAVANARRLARTKLR
jgi:hypothetical protein